MQRSNLVLGALQKFAMFGLPSNHQLVRYRLHIWQIGRSNGGIASEKLSVTLTYFCDIYTHLKENFQMLISRRLLQLQRRNHAQSYSSECLCGRWHM